MSRYYQGKFKPQNPHKYKGDPTNIIYRSSWELKVLIYFDKHPDVLEYSSEEIVIPYRSPIDGKIHRYFPDFFMRRRDKDGKTKGFLIEVKPKAQTVPPKVQGKPTKRYINEVATWGVNSAKWKMAEQYCADRGWDFIKITEDDLGLTF
jgi:hypothetical protein